MDELSIRTVVETFSNIMHDRASRSLDLVAQSKIFSEIFLLGQVINQVR